MHRLAGDDPQPLSRQKRFAAEEAFFSLCSGIGDFHADGQCGITRQVVKRVNGSPVLPEQEEPRKCGCPMPTYERDSSGC